MQKSKIFNGFLGWSGCARNTLLRCAKSYCIFLNLCIFNIYFILFSIRFCNKKYSWILLSYNMSQKEKGQAIIEFIKLKNPSLLLSIIFSILELSCNEQLNITNNWGL